MNGFLEKVTEQSVANAAGMPGWFEALREQGAETFARHGLPHTRLEDWKYTTLKRLGQEVPADASRDSVFDWQLEAPVTLRLSSTGGLKVNGQAVDGVEIESLEDAVRHRGDELRPVLESLETEQPAQSLNALNNAVLGQGVVVRVSPGVAAGRVLIHWEDAIDAALDSPRVILQLGAGASLEWVEVFATKAPAAQALNVVSQLLLGEGAALTQVRVQQGSARDSLITRCEVRQSADSLFKQTSLDIGQGLARHDTVIHLAGTGARCELGGAYLPRGNAHVDHHLWVEHEAPGCSSKQFFRGVLDDRSRAVFSGRVHVHPGADDSSAEQSNANLLLSEDAEIDTKPELIIEADEVVASHGATVGQLDDVAIFYLRSRGLSGQQARELMTAAFCQAVIDELESKDLHAALTAALADVLEVRL